MLGLWLRFLVNVDVVCVWVLWCWNGWIHDCCYDVACRVGDVMICVVIDMSCDVMWLMGCNSLVCLGVLWLV